MDPLLAKLAGVDRVVTRRRATTALVIVGVVALVIAVVVGAVQGGGSAVPYPSVPTASSRALTTASATPSALLVQVSGAVHRPGLVSVPAGARGIDAVTAAGGLLPGADQSAVNLAAKVADGQQIIVPTRGAAAAPAATAGQAATGPVSLGSATLAQLETLPRIGPAMAQRILDWRTAHGGFSSVDDLQKVTGIGAKTFAALKALVVP